MPKKKRPSPRKGKPREELLTLAPRTFDESVEMMLRAKPVPLKPKKKPTGRKPKR